MRLQTIALAFAMALATPLSSSAQPADPLWAKVDAALGATGKDLPGGVHRFGWPRRDLHVQVGEVAVEPALALGWWGASSKQGKPAWRWRWATWCSSKRSSPRSSPSSRPAAS